VWEIIVKFHNSVEESVVSVRVIIIGFQPIDPGSSPGRRISPDLWGGSSPGVGN
jgi:hypothetical protein